MAFTTPGESPLRYRQDNRKVSRGHEDVVVMKERTPQPGHTINLRAGGAYVPTVFVGMYATLGLSMPSQHFVHGQDRSAIPEIEPPTQRRPVARLADQASFHGIVVQVIQFLITSPKVATPCFLKRSESIRRARRYVLVVK
jgi:hypothetical protein